jgi:hypothetical protein
MSRSALPLLLALRARAPDEAGEAAPDASVAQDAAPWDTRSERGWTSQTSPRCWNK